MTTTSSSSLGGGLPKEETNHNDEDVEALPHGAKARNSSNSSSSTSIHNEQSFGRSLDEFLQAAISLPRPHGNNDNSNSMSHIKRMLQCLQVQWRYWLVFVCLGVANSSDAAEILCLSYMLSNRTFQRQILLSSDSDSDTESSSSWRAGMLAATVFCGMLLGGLLVGGSWGDAAGRRPVLLAGLATNAVAGLASAAVAWNVASLSCIRFVAGIGIGASIPPLFALCSELAAPAQRGLCVTIAASFWMVGSIYVAVTAWWWFGGSGSETNQDEEDDDRGWRVFAAACAFPSALGFWLVHRYVPESPRFLLTTTANATSSEQQQQQRSYQEEKAVSIVQDLANRAGYRGPPWTLEEARRHHHHQPQQQAPSLPLDDAPLLMMGDNTYTSLTSSSSPTHHHHHSRAAATAAVAGWCRRLVLLLRQTWHDFYVSAAKLYVPEGQLRQITWPLQMVWFSLSFGTYGLYTWINTLFFAVHMQNVYQNALLFAAANLPGNIVSAVLMDRIGRATLLTSSVLAAALSLVSFAYIAFYDDDTEKNNNNTNNNNDTNNDPPISTSWIVVSACAFQCFTIVAWNAIDVLTSELFPTTVRSTGMGICAASGRIGAMLAQFINGILVARPVALLLVAAVTLLVGAVTPVLLPTDQTGQPVRDDIVVVRVVPEQQRESKTVVGGGGGGGAMEEGESLQELMDRRRHRHHHHPQMEGTDVAAGHRQHQQREEDLTYRALSSSSVAANHDNQAYQSSAAQQQ